MAKPRLLLLDEPSLCLATVRGRVDLNHGNAAAWSAGLGEVLRLVGEKRYHEGSSNLAAYILSLKD
jgi:hypothetical protein